MTLPITSIYAAALGMVCLFLSVQVIRYRAKANISLDNGGDPRLAEHIRRHGNFVEFVPISLILLGLAEVGGARSIWLHAVGLLLLVARLIHPFGIDHSKAATVSRIIGASGTQLAIALAIGLILWRLVS
jgi:uncharacterized protein